MPRITLHIEGMSCGHCLTAVSRALNAVPGARVASVRIGRAEIDAAAEAAPVLAAAVTESGYRATAVVQE